MKAWNYLSGWTSFSLPKNIQKRLYKFLLRKAIGQFLQNELDLENFDIGIMNGSVELRDLDLNLQTLNKLLNDTPFILEEGRVACIHASIPWTTFWSGDISLKIQGLHLALRPMKNKPKMDESFSSSPTAEEPIMSSSLHFADDFLKSEIGGDQTQELHESIQKSFNTDTEDVDMEGLQVLTKVIDKMLAKIKIDVVDTVIRVIHKSAVPFVPGDEREYHLDVCVPRISYYDETPEFNSNNVNVEPPAIENLMESSILLPPAANETIKCIAMTAPEIWLRSSPSPNILANSSNSIYSLPTQSETTINEEYEDLSQTEFFDTEGGTSFIFQQQDDLSGSVTPKAFRQQPANKPYKALLFTTMNERNHVRMKLRPSFDDTSLLPIKQMDFFVAHMRATITPLQVAFFLDLLDAMSTNNSVNLQPQSNFMQHASPSATANPILDDLDSYQTNAPYTPSNLPSNQPSTSSPNLKIKINMSLIELYVLADDDPVTNWDIPYEGKSHIRFAIEQPIVRIQKFSQKSSIIDFKIHNIVLSEWIKNPTSMQQQSRHKDRSRTNYEAYNAILEFDNKIRYDYHDEDMFPNYDPSIYINEEKHSEVVRVRIERTERGRPNEDVVSFDEEVNVDIQAFRVLIDPRIIDRYEKYILAVTALQKGKEEENQFSFATTPQMERRPSVFDDLHHQEKKTNRKIRVKFAFIRIILFVPDMSQTSTREEFNDRFHKDQLSIDIKKLMGTWSSTDQHTVMDEEPTGFASHEKRPMKIHLELSYVNVFMHLKHDKLARTWFTAKTLHDVKYLSEDTLCPKIEITIQDPDIIYPSKARQSVYFGTGSEIPTTLFDFLSRNEEFDGEQKLHVPMEEQSDSATLFKQTTVETSIIAVNCHFPQTRMNLTKPLWDKVQIIQNDLLLWQPKFLISQQQNEDMSMSSHQTSSMMSQSHERLARPPQFTSQSSDQARQKTLISIVAVLSSGVWDIHTSDVHCYRLNFSEFKYFVAMKHLGQNENITTLDIEELTLTDISNISLPVLLLYKTIPKTIRSKKDTSMVSLFSRLNNYPEFNRLNKITSVVACNICWKATPNIDFINQIVDFQKVPQEMVFIDPPTQYIKVFAHILETSIDHAPINSPSRAVLIFDGVQVITDILAGQPFIDIKTCIQTIELLMIDDVKEMTSHDKLNGKTADARKYWSSMGLVHLLALLNIEVQVKVKLDEHAVGPQVDVSLVSTDIHMDSNTDSFQTLLNFITFLSNNGDGGPTTAPPATATEKKKLSSRRTVTPHQIVTKNDLLASLDENAFKTSPTSSHKISPPTFIEAPDMEDFNYVEEFYKSPEAPIGSSSIFINPSKPPRKPRRKQQQQQRSKPSEDIIRVLVSPEEQESESFTVVEDYFGAEKKVSAPNSVVDTDKAILSLRIKQVNFIWKLYDGYTWKYIRSEMASKQHGFSPEESELIIQKDALVEIKLDAVSLDFDLMPDNDVTALYTHLLIKDVEIIDNIKTSTWKKFLGYMRPPLKEKPREVDACMVDVELISLRPVQDDPQQEFRLKAKMLPIRLYVDHDALNFLVKFFTFEKSHLRSTNAANKSISKESANEEEEEKGNGMFFQYVDIFPITLKVDYKPKYINYGNIKEGQLAELVNLFHLDGAEMSLTHVKLTGIKGMDGLLERLGQEWLPHIKNTQVTNMVSGVSPIRSIVNLSNGVADLVLLPIQQYRKDGRIIKGIQRGTTSFARATAIEAIKLSSRVATGTQVILEHADGFFSPPSSSSSNQILQDQHFVYSDIYGVDIPTHDDTHKDDEKRKREDKRPALTSEISDGFQFAYQNLSRNLGSAAQTIFAVPTEIGAQDSEDFNTETGAGSSSNNGSHGKSVIRAVPVAVIKPMIGLTGAFQTILTGLRNSIDPVMRLQSEDKYKKRK